MLSQQSSNSCNSHLNDSVGLACSKFSREVGKSKIKTIAVKDGLNESVIIRVNPCEKNS